ncbi:MAG: glutathione transferase GstA [Hyphomonadaceae bacterium]
MKLYYVPGACSLAPHIVIREAGLDVALDKVSFGAQRTTSTGRNFFEVSPRGAVPVLELDGGEILTENAALLQFLAAQAPDKGLAPSEGMAHWRLLETLNFIATELHKGFSPLFRNPPEDQRKAQIAQIINRFELLTQTLGDKPYLMGDSFTVADAYAFVVLTWARRFELDLSGLPKLQAYYKRMLERTGVQQALTEEGLPTS